MADLEEVYRLRRSLEAEALRRGVPTATAADLSALRAAAEECRSAGDAASRLAANRRFHELLHGLAGSRPLLRLIGLLWDSTEAYRALYYALPGEAAQADLAHAAILAAVADGDAERAVALEDAHRDRALARLREALGQAA